MDYLTADTKLVESYLWIPEVLLYLPAGIFAGIVILELVDAFQKTRENDRAVLALLIFGLVATLISTHLGLAMRAFLGDWGNFPFGQLFLGYLLGFSLLVTWSFKLLARRSWRKSAQLATKHRMTKHRTSGSRALSYTYALTFTVSIVLAAACMSYKADFGDVPAFVTLGVPGKAEDMPQPPPPVTPPPAVVAQSAPPPEAPSASPEMANADPAGGDPEMSDAPEPEPEPEPENKEPQPQPMPKAKAVARAAPADANLTVEFASQVEPILKERCYECHGETKDKGELRIHTPAGIRKGGDGGPAVVSGKPEDSPLYFLTTLDPKDEDIMPSKGDPLAAEQIEILRTWILEGAFLADGRRADDTTVVAAAEGDEGGDMAGEEDPPLSVAIVIPNDEYLEAMRSEGIIVTRVPGDDLMLEIDYSKAGKNAGEIDLRALYPIARNIVRLTLSRVPVADSDLEPLQELKNLVHLRLDRTNIGDSVLYDLSGLKKLETLNLFATRVTDSGVGSLDSLENIKELVLMNTLVTADGAARLRKNHPDAEIQAPE